MEVPTLAFIQGFSPLAKLKIVDGPSEFDKIFSLSSACAKHIV